MQSYHCYVRMRTFTNLRREDLWQRPSPNVHEWPWLTAGHALLKTKMNSFVSVFRFYLCWHRGTHTRRQFLHNLAFEHVDNNVVVVVGRSVFFSLFFVFLHGQRKIPFEWALIVSSTCSIHVHSNADAKLPRLFSGSDRVGSDAVIP